MPKGLLQSRKSRRLAVVAAVVAAVTALTGTIAVTSAQAVTKLSHSDAKRRVNNAGIGIVSSGGCSDRNNPTCTSLSKVNLSSVKGIITLKQASKCKVTITGGTETGHAGGTYSHWNGYKLDIRPYDCVSGYIKRTFRYIGERGDGAKLWKSGAGNIYARESNHWDILYYNCGGC